MYGETEKKIRTDKGYGEQNKKIKTHTKKCFK